MASKPPLPPLPKNGTNATAYARVVSNARNMKQATIDCVSKNIDTMIQGLESLQEVCSQQTTQITTVTTEKSQVEDKAKKLEVENGTLKSQVGELKKALDNNNAAATLCRNETQRMNAEIATLKTRPTAVPVDVKPLEAAVSNLARQLNTLQCYPSGSVKAGTAVTKPVQAGTVVPKKSVSVTGATSAPAAPASTSKPIIRRGGAAMWNSTTTRHKPKNGEQMMPLYDH